MLLTNVWWSNVSAKIPTIVPSAPNSTSPSSDGDDEHERLAHRARR